MGLLMRRFYRVPLPLTLLICERTFGSVLNMMDVRPDMTYAQSAAAYYDWMQRYDPAVFNGIKERVKDGRWEVVGGMWIEPDCDIPRGESWMHQMLYSQRYFRNNLGVMAKIGWNPDSFGYTWNMPEFYLNAFITQKIGWNDTNVFPYRVFWWEAPDGSRILSYFPFPVQRESRFRRDKKELYKDYQGLLLVYAMASCLKNQTRRNS